MDYPCVFRGKEGIGNLWYVGDYGRGSFVFFSSRILAEKYLKKAIKSFIEERIYNEDMCEMIFTIEDMKRGKKSFFKRIIQEYGDEVLENEKKINKKLLDWNSSKMKEILLETLFNINNVKCNKYVNLEYEYEFRAYLLGYLDLRLKDIKIEFY